MSRKLRFGVLAAAALLGASATAYTTVSAGGHPAPATAGGGGGGTTIEVVTHGQASDPFWSVFKRGVEDAAAQMGATVELLRPGHVRHGGDVAADRRRRGEEPRRPRRLGARLRRAEGLAGSRPRRRHPDHHRQLGLRRVPGDRRDHPRRPGRDDRRRGRRPAPRRRRRDARACASTRRSATPGSTPAAPAPRRSIEAAGGTLEVVQVDLNDAAGAQSTISADAAGRRHHRRRARARPDRCLARRSPRSTRSARPATSSSARSTSART